MLHCKIFGQVKFKKKDGKGYTCKVALEVKHIQWISIESDLII